jgi:hypothetical protein
LEGRSAKTARRAAPVIPGMINPRELIFPARLR